MAAFDGRSADPLGTLRQEGEPAASQVRQGLDRVSPGLGNPVMKVDVHEMDQGMAHPEAGDVPGADPLDALALQQGLALIAGRLELLEQRLGCVKPTDGGGN